MPAWFDECQSDFEDLGGPLPAGFDEFDCTTSALDSWLLSHSLLHNPEHNQFGITPRDLNYRRGLTIEMRGIEGLGQAKAVLRAEKEKAQAVAAQRAMADGQRNQAIDAPRAEHASGHAVADLNLTPRLLAQRPFVARVRAGHLHALI